MILIRIGSTLILFICATYSAFAQSIKPGEYEVCRFTSEQLLLPPNDYVALKRFDIADDSVWNYIDYDTNSSDYLSVSGDYESNMVPGVNMVSCFNGGEVLNHWNFSDSTLVCRASFETFSPTEDCSIESRFSLYGVLFGNGETMPDISTPLYSYDQFHFHHVSHQPGFPRWKYLSENKGLKVLDLKRKGTLITPFDTIENCWLIRETGVLFKDNSDEIEYKFTKFYWPKEDVGYPLMTRYQWERTLRATLGTYIRKVTSLLKYQNPNVIQEVSQYTDCLLYPNPFQTCFNHQFQDDNIEVVNLQGQAVAYDQQFDQICLASNNVGLFVVIGTCNGRRVAKPVYHDASIR